MNLRELWDNLAVIRVTSTDNSQVRSRNNASTAPKCSCTYHARYGRTNEQRQGVRPRQQPVLLPPPFDDEADVEPQNERHGDTLTLLPKIMTDFFEYPKTQTFCYFNIVHSLQYQKYANTNCT
jgi:hypothetical protein